MFPSSKYLDQSSNNILSTLNLLEAISFLCPGTGFRKDVIQRIIEDQLARSTPSETGERCIGLIQMAATADLIGLRATQVNATEKQIQRLQLPAIAIKNNQPSLSGQRIWLDKL